MPPLAEAHNLSTIEGVRHGFFGRQGGTSTGIYESLNLGQGSGDSDRAIVANRKLVKDAVSADHLLSCYQVHSARAVHVFEPFEERPEADAMVTDSPGLGLCVLSADCVPVLFADPVRKVIGAAHAGWKGALGGVCEATLEAMIKIGAKREQIVAAIGPAIQQDSYEVGPEFRDRFNDKDRGYDRFFRPGEGDRYHFDITGFVQSTLLGEGIAAVDNLGHDTCAMEETYFSNRRRNHKQEPDYGRNGSVIVIQHGE